MNFVSPWFLAALAGIGLPVLFHLVKGAKFEVKELATLRWVGAGVSPRRVRRQVARWPLLIVRMLAVAVLALLGARPFLSEAQPVPPLREVVVAVDVSGSMARREPLVRKALEKVKADLPPDTPLRVVRFADAVRPFEGTNLPQALQGAATSYDRLVQWGIDQAASEGAMRLVVISDFTRPALEGLRPRVWPAGAEVRLEPVGRPDAWNAGIVRVNCLTPVASDGVEIEAELAFHGLTPSEPFVLHLKTEDGVEREETVPAGTSRVRFRWPVSIPAAGLAVRGELTLRPAGAEGRGDGNGGGGGGSGADEIAWDDRQAFAFPVVRQRKVLLVEGDSGDSVFAGECYFADKALRAGLGSGAGSKSPFAPAVRPALGDLQGFQAVVLANVAEVSPDDARRVADFVRSGGGLLVAGGERVTPALAEALRTAGLDVGVMETSGGSAGAAGAGARAVEPGSPGEAGPAVHPASGQGNPLSALPVGWNAVSFARSRNFTPPKNAVNWLEDDRGGAVLSALPENAAGGRALLMAHPLDADGNDFPRHPLYVLLMREMMGYLTHFQASAREFPAVAAGMDEARAPGVYPEAKGGWEIVRAEESESDIVSEPLAKVRAAFGLSENPVVQNPAAGRSAAGVPLTRQRPSEWWPWLAGLLLALFGLESLMAARSPRLVRASALSPSSSASSSSFSQSPPPGSLEPGPSSMAGQSLTTSSPESPYVPSAT